MAATEAANWSWLIMVSVCQAHWITARLNFHEFENMIDQTVFVSATPGDYELEKTGGVVVEQVVRPTGLLDPPIEIRPSVNQIDDLLDEIDKRVKKGDRVLVTTLTKRMAEEMDKYLHRINIKSKYIHSEVDTLERVEILRQLQAWEKLMYWLA